VAGLSIFVHKDKSGGGPVMSKFDIRWAISDGIRGSISFAEICIGIYQFKEGGKLFKCRFSQINHLHLIRWMTIVIASSYLILSLVSKFFTMLAY